MSEYYAVVRSNDHLAHYGVKGMKWGVQKAIDRGNDRALAKQYTKASKKLAKLQNKSDIDYQKNRIKNATNKQKMATKAAAMNLGIAGGLTAANYTATKRAGGGVLNTYLPVGAGVAGASIAARQIGKNKAKKLITDKGHKNAVNKEREFRSEMQKAFKGTKYSNNVEGMARDIAKEKRKKMANKVAKYEERYRRSLQGRAEAYANNQKANRKRR